MPSGVMHELLELAPAWTVLVGYLALPKASPKTVPPRDIYERALDCDYSRLVALLYAHGHGDTMDESRAILAELLEMAADGRRPRYGPEVIG